MKDEIWKAIPGYAGFCEVSSAGRVRTLDRLKHGGGGRFYTLRGRIRALRLDKDGYCLVTLTNGAGDNETHKVHRLVARVFHREPAVGEEVNHINANRSDNRSSNVEWSSHGDNIRDSYTRRLPPSRKAVVADRESSAVGFWFPSISAVKTLGFNRNAVHLCLSGSQQKHRGLMWRYV